MKTITNPANIPCIERDGGCMPVVGLGTWESTESDGRKAVRTALEAGYRHIDTARMYENEKPVGEGIADSGVPRDEIFLTTKIWMDQLDPSGVRDSCDKSLQLLGVDYIDLLLIHWPEESVPLATTLGAMKELREAGKIRHLGISNFTAELTERAVDAIDVPIFCNQVEYHPFLDQSTLLSRCRSMDIPLVAYCPLAHGRAVKDSTLQEIGKKHEKSAAQVALRWLIQQDGVVAIPKGSSNDHIMQNMDLFDFDLDASDLEAIADLQTGKHLINPDWAPEWDESKGVSPIF